MLPQVRRLRLNLESPLRRGLLANKGSPFIRFISAANLGKDKPQDKDKNKVSPFHSLPHSQESLKDTGEDRLERLLSEAAEEARARVRAKSILSGYGDPPTPIASTMLKKVLRQTTLLPKKVGKRAKPRHTLAGWMNHKYPILKYFVTAPADAARYPHKYRCRVCLVELSLMTKGPLEILAITEPMPTL